MKKLTILPLALAAFAMTGCAVTTAGITKGDERNMSRSINDVTAGRAISTRMSRAYDFKLGKVDVEVAEGIAVLTGSVPTPEDKMEAERIAWSAPNVVQVGNEIMVGARKNLIRGTKDTVVATRVRTKLIAEKGVKSRNVNIETYNGVVYLLGVARDADELQRMTYLASTTDGVKEVVSYIKIADRPVVTPAGFMPPSSFGTPVTGAAPMPSVPLPSVPRLPAPGALPGEQSAQSALPSLPRLPQSSGPSLPETEPYYRDPVTGERIILPPGTKTIPYNPNGSSTLGIAPNAPYYIDPSNGEKVQIIWKTDG